MEQFSRWASYTAGLKPRAKAVSKREKLIELNDIYFKDGEQNKRTSKLHSSHSSPMVPGRPIKPYGETTISVLVADSLEMIVDNSTMSLWASMNRDV